MKNLPLNKKREEVIPLALPNIAATNNTTKIKKSDDGCC